MSEKLEISSRAGDFVHQNQTMAKQEGFSCVSRIWWGKTQPLSQGIDAIYDEQRKRADIMATFKEMQFIQRDDGQIVVEHIDGREFSPTEHGWKQLAKWCYVPQGFLNAYMSDPLVNGKVAFVRDNVDRKILMDVFRNGARRIREDKQFLFRTYNDGTLRACLTDSYAIVDNVWYLEVLQDLFKELGATEPRLSHWKGDADTIFGNLLIPDTVREDKDSDYGGMLSISNCEIGRRRLEQFPSVFRAICMNGCIWDQKKGTIMSKVHRGEINHAELRESIVNNIHTQIPLLGDGVQRFLNTRVLTLPKQVTPAQAIAELALTEKFTFGMKGQATKVLENFVKHEIDNRNLFGLINSVTRAGQEYDNQTWVRFDEVGGKMMNWNANKWDSFNNRASQLDKAAMEEVFGAAV